jgi:hypothetical protein
VALADLFQRQALNHSQAQQLAGSPVGDASKPAARYRRQCELVLGQSADGLVEARGIDTGVEQLPGSAAGQLLGGGDPGGVQAGGGGLAEAKRGDLHEEPASVDAVADELDLADGRAGGEDVAV